MSNLKALTFGYKGGYTLVELIVSVGIIVLLGALLAPKFSAIGEDQALQNATEELKTKLLEAQSYALAPPENNQGATAYGVEVKNEKGVLAYRLVRYNGSHDPKREYFKGSEFTTPANVKKDPSNAQTVWFEIGNRIIVKTGDQPTAPVLASDTQISLKLIVGSQSETRVLSINPTTGAIDAK